MSLVFEPTHQSGSDALSDCRIALVTHYTNAKSDDAKSMGMDIRLSPRTVKDMGIRNGDRLIARREDDGTWWFTLVLPNQRGFIVRLGGSKQHNGRKGCGYFRISVTPETGRTLFPDGERSLELDLVGVEGRTACFTPSAVRSQTGLTFTPSH